SFYDLINLKKQPSIVIKVCSSVTCASNDAFKLIKEIENYFRIKSGDDYNPKVKLEIISCLERCGEGPIMLVNDKIYTNVTKSSVAGILGEWL
ncbi:MAG TPA: NAD(P)H-dependent oxidoreductase subunit E, partial [Patescibacteria group bacterium]|nr:NAD(P)H-dependent oxidoreductase subunit E [Patescibacteria group bacterium]